MAPCRADLEALASLRPPGLVLPPHMSGSDSEVESGTAGRERRRICLAARCAVSELQCVLAARLDAIEGTLMQVLSAIGKTTNGPPTCGAESQPDVVKEQPEPEESPLRCAPECDAPSGSHATGGAFLGISS